MRCDGPCPSRALAKVTKQNTQGGTTTLNLCGHHTRINHEKLTAEGWRIELEAGAEKSAWLPESLIRDVSPPQDLSAEARQDMLV